MLFRSSAVLLIVTTLSVFHLCYADLPIHCLQHQVVGEWKLQISEPRIINDKSEMSCGHSSPDDPAVSYLANRDNFKPSQDFIVTLGEDAKVAGKAGSGTWTMVYDEAVDILLDNSHRFTAFFDYYPDAQGKVMSYCGRTVVGWYHNLISGTRACFKGEKQLKNGEKEEDLNGTPLFQMHVVQPNETHSLLQIGYTSRNAKMLRSSTQNKGFRDQQSVVDHLNKLASKSWKARTYPQFEGKSFVQLNQFVGRQKTTHKRPSLQNSLIQTVDVSDLPKEFTWKNQISPARSQGSCGSCYVFSTMAMLEARLRIKYEKDVHLSVQHVLDCSFYNQGCKGGYPFLVEKYATDFELVPEECSPYKAETGEANKCGTCNTKSLNEVYRATNYKFIGGAYGKSNEREMMLEVMKNGPIVVSFEPPSDFMYYESGVYHNVDPDWLQAGEDKPEWERVDHSVMLYGWGETEEGEKYWSIMNSWGEDWGEAGSFRMRRGNDECAVESMGEAAEPVIIKQHISA